MAWPPQTLPVSVQWTPTALLPRHARGVSLVRWTAHLAVNGRAARPGVPQLLQHQHARALAHHEAVPVRIKRPVHVVAMTRAAERHRQAPPGMVCWLLASFNLQGRVLAESNTGMTRTHARHGGCPVHPGGRAPGGLCGVVVVAGGQRLEAAEACEADGVNTRLAGARHLHAEAGIRGGVSERRQRGSKQHGGRQGSAFQVGNRRQGGGR